MDAAQPREIVVNVSGIPTDPASVAALARIRMCAWRFGHPVRLTGASTELCELVVLMGLAEVLGVEAGREPEQPEQRLRVEEERELGDATA